MGLGSRELNVAAPSAADLSNTAARTATADLKVLDDAGAAQTQIDGLRAQPGGALTLLNIAEDATEREVHVLFSGCAGYVDCILMQADGGGGGGGGAKPKAKGKAKGKAKSKGGATKRAASAGAAKAAEGNEAVALALADVPGAGALAKRRCAVVNFEQPEQAWDAMVAREGTRWARQGSPVVIVAAGMPAAPVVPAMVGTVGAGAIHSPRMAMPTAPRAASMGAAGSMAISSPELGSPLSLPSPRRPVQAVVSRGPTPRHATGGWLVDTYNSRAPSPKASKLCREALVQQAQAFVRIEEVWARERSRRGWPTNYARYAAFCGALGGAEAAYDLCDRAGLDTMKLRDAILLLSEHITELMSERGAQVAAYPGDGFSDPPENFAYSDHVDWIPSPCGGADKFSFDSPKFKNAAEEREVADFRRAELQRRRAKAEGDLAVRRLQWLRAAEPPYGEVPGGGGGTGGM
eukprot:TRINITY_DN2922_c0_g2_i1.p1 TRINITY_DN2922_c0_g2~~TRINITY_DN2922_c0_g2_i1.p1  ORF type:complete len:464 (-),score=101.27 TRINITY_DN2922_c0_g2_i1:76-1467(-)